MSATATRPETSYLFRKLHSLSGIVPVGAFLVQQLDAGQRGEIQPDLARTADDSVSSFRGMGFYFHTHFVSRRVRDLYLAARRVQRFAISVGEKLVVYVSAVHGADRVYLYWVERVHATLANAWNVDQQQSCAADAEPLGVRVHGGRNRGYVISLRRGHLEFSVQVGPGGDGAGAAGGGAVGSRGWHCL